MHIPRIIARVFAVTAALGAVMPPAAASAAEAYFFGDSLTDDGKTFGTFPLAPQLGAPPFPPSPPYFEGRYSNGLMWSEIVAERLGLASDIDRNFAIGGATSRLINDPANPFQTLANFSGQIDLFEQAFGRFEASDLAFVNFWGNDAPQILRVAAEGGPSVEEGIGLTVGAIIDGMERLTLLGAEDITVFNYPDIALTPFVANDPDGFEAEFGLTLADLGAVTDAFNAALGDAVTAFGAATGALVTVVDLNSLFDDIADDPAAFGFGPIEEACLNSRSTAVTAVPNPARDCTDPDILASTLFWDQNFHPTTAGQTLIADTVLGARGEAMEIPTPSPLALIAGVLALFWMRRRP